MALTSDRRVASLGVCARRCGGQFDRSNDMRMNHTTIRMNVYTTSRSWRNVVLRRVRAWRVTPQQIQSSAFQQQQQQQQEGLG